MASDRWIKLYMMDDDEVYHDSKMVHLWIDILLHTNANDFYSKGDLVRRGQCILSLRQVADRCSMSKDTVSKYLKLLEECGKITCKKTNKGTIVTVLNWDIYQSPVPPSVLKQGHQQGHKQGHQQGHQQGRNKKKEIDIEERDDLDRFEIFKILSSLGLESYTDDIYQRCQGKKINNLKNYVLKIAEGIRKEKPQKQEATPEEKEQFKKLMETLEDG